MKLLPVFYKQVNGRNDYSLWQNFLLDSSKRCLDYLISISHSIDSTKDLLIKLFNQYPSVKFAIDITKYASIKYLHGDELVLLFLQLDQYLNAVQFVEQLIQEKGANYEKEEAEKLQTCFDILKKYSYLVDEKVCWKKSYLFFVYIKKYFRLDSSTTGRRRKCQSK